MELNEIIDKAMDNAIHHSWSIRWDRADKPDISVGEAIALCHSELSEALDAYRHNDIEHFNEEIADAVIRLCHMSGELKIDLEYEIIKKMKFNCTREKNNGKINL